MRVLAVIVIVPLALLAVAVGSFILVSALALMVSAG